MFLSLNKWDLVHDPVFSRGTWSIFSEASAPKLTIGGGESAGHARETSTQLELIVVEMLVVPMFMLLKIPHITHDVAGRTATPSSSLEVFR